MSASQYPKPPFPAQTQAMPGATNKMDPRPDHGETSYKGSGKLQGKVAIITGRRQRHWTRGRNCLRA